MAAEDSKDSKGKAAAKPEPPLDPRLDNRVGDQRPYDSGIKPQQVYGGQPGNESEEEDPVSDNIVEEGENVGHGSPGPHGRGYAKDRAQAAKDEGEA